MVLYKKTRGDLIKKLQAPMHKTVGRFICLGTGKEAEGRTMAVLLNN